MNRFHPAWLALSLLAFPITQSLHAQGTATAAVVPTTGSLHGVVADPLGAVIPGATVSLTDAQGHTLASTSSSGDGSYSFPSVAPGTYVILVNAPGFGALSTRGLPFPAGANRVFNPVLLIQVQQQNVQVNADAPTVSVDPDSNGNSVVIKGKDIDALSDDPDELSNELTALAGPAAGPSGGQIYIDGFTGGQLPPKSSIREIRVNQNPYGAQFDKIGFGRVEVFTKPGTDKFHGQVYAQGNARQFNTGNPFRKNLPDYHSYQYEGSLSGPLGHKASFFVSAQRRDIQDDSVVSAFRLLGEVNGDFAAGIFTNPGDYTGDNYAAPFKDAINTPQTRTNISPRFDIQLTEKNSLRIRYEFERNVQSNQGVGQFSLASQGYSSTSTENEIQVSDTHVFGPRVIMENNISADYTRSAQNPANRTPQVQVQGNQTFGGQSEQSISDHYDNYELSNLTEFAFKMHSISIGGRIRATREANAADSSFNGLFTFTARACPAAGCPTGGATNPCQSGALASNGCTAISAAQSYALTVGGQHNGQTFQQIQAAGGGPAQLVFITGDPKAAVHYIDGALFYQDDWKYRPNLTLSYGLRWESQTDLHTHNYWAPRLAVAYGVTHHGKPTKDILRAGFGYFYDRFGIAPVLQASRVNGVVQRETVLQNPTCYLPDGLPDAATLPTECAANTSATTTAGNSSASPAIYRLGPDLKAPANIQESVGLDHQLFKSTTLSLTYIHSHGAHALDTINANAPYSPTYNPALGNVYQYFSEGVYNQNQLFLNFHAQINRSLSAFGFYGLSYASGDVNGRGSFPSNSLNLKQDYGRAAFDVRNRLFLIGTYSAPHFIRVSPFVVAQSGNPFNITLSQDANGDSIFNDRPSFASSGATGSNIIKNRYGTFNTAPTAGTAPIPINDGSGPSLVTLNLRLSKTWGFGQRLQKEGAGDAQPGSGGGPPRGFGGPGGGRGGPGGGVGGGAFGNNGNNGNTGRRYNFTLNAQALNLLNIVNYAPPTGTIDSPNFGRSNALAGQIFSSPNGSASRRIFLQATFAF